MVPLASEALEDDFPRQSISNICSFRQAMMSALSQAARLKWVVGSPPKQQSVGASNT